MNKLKRTSTTLRTVNAPSSRELSRASANLTASSKRVVSLAQVATNGISFTNRLIARLNDSKLTRTLMRSNMKETITRWFSHQRCTQSTSEALRSPSSPLLPRRLALPSRINSMRNLTSWTRAISAHWQTHKVPICNHLNPKITTISRMSVVACQSASPHALTWRSPSATTSTYSLSILTRTQMPSPNNSSLNTTCPLKCMRSFASQSRPIL